MSGVICFQMFLVPGSGRLLLSQTNEDGFSALSSHCVVSCRRLRPLQFAKQTTNISLQIYSLVPSLADGKTGGGKGWKRERRNEREKEDERVSAPLNMTETSGMSAMFFLPPTPFLPHLHSLLPSPSSFHPPLSPFSSFSSPSFLQRSNELKHINHHKQFVTYLSS